MNPNRKSWNANHQKLTRALAKAERNRAIELFLDQHAMVHPAKVARGELVSFDDELLWDMTAEEVRQVPEGGEHSVAWILFHLARIEDITMNMLVAGTEQLFTLEDWAKKLKVSILHSANKMDAASVSELSAKIDINCLHEYRISVARQTRQIVKKLRAADFKQRVDLARIEKVLAEKAVSSEAMDILHYWSKKTIAGLLLMPPTRHCILHLNEAERIKAKIRKANQ